MQHTILYEDDCVVVVNKPNNMLSVPGKIEFNKIYQPRYKEWETSVKGASTFVTATATKECLDALNILANYDNVPRKRRSFYSFVQRSLRITEEKLLEEMWNSISLLDTSLHKISYNDIPPHLISSAEMLERAYGKVFAVHRLDCATSGLLIFAKTDNTASELCRQFRNREVDKIYIAEVSGKFPLDIKKVVLPLRSDMLNKPRQVVDYENGKFAETHVEVLKFRQRSEGDGISSVVMLIPYTGRTHQLRVHMSESGYPILGDDLYGVTTTTDNESKSSTAIHSTAPIPTPFLALHALSLAFTHPTTKQRMSLKALPCPFYDIDDTDTATMNNILLKVKNSINTNSSLNKEGKQAWEKKDADSPVVTENIPVGNGNNTVVNESPVNSNDCKVKIVGENNSTAELYNDRFPPIIENCKKIGSNVEMRTNDSCDLVSLPKKPKL